MTFIFHPSLLLLTFFFLNEESKKQPKTDSFSTPSFYSLFHYGCFCFCSLLLFILFFALFLTPINAPLLHWTTSLFILLTLKDQGFLTFFSTQLGNKNVCRHWVNVPLLSNFPFRNSTVWRFLFLTGTKCLNGSYPVLCGVLLFFSPFSLSAFFWFSKLQRFELWNVRWCRV